MSKMNSNVSFASNNTSKSDDNVVISASYHTNQFLARNICKPPKYYIYSMAILAPLYRIKVLKRSYGNNNYKQEVADRFGRRYKKNKKKFDDVSLTKLNNNSDISIDKNEANTLPIPMVWCHAVSLGETNTVAPLLKRLMKEGCHIWLTNTTHTGYTRSQILFAEQIKLGQLQHGFVPIDKPKVIKKFLDYVKPKVALFVETELWANILYQLANRNIPSILVNARLSENSFIQYQKIDKVSRSMMKNIGFILAQDSGSAKRFRMLGADSSKIRVVGSLKWTVNSDLISGDTKSVDYDAKFIDDNVDTNETCNDKINEGNPNELNSIKNDAEEPLISSYAERAEQRKRRKSAKLREKLPQQLLPKKTVSKLTEDKLSEVTSRPQDREKSEKENPLGHKSTKIKQRNKKPIEEKTGIKANDSVNSDNSIKEPNPTKNELLTLSNLKSEISQNLRLKSRNNKKRLVWVAASTHQSEEIIALLAHQKLIKQSKQSLSTSLLVIVPRHPERFEEVAHLIADSGLKYRRRSQNERPDETTQVYLADSMGELLVWYDMADIAFVGGSMVNCGGHNPIEAIALETPVIMGQYTHSCQLIVDKLFSARVLRQIVSRHKKGHGHTKGKPLNKEVISELSEQLFLDVKGWLENSKDRHTASKKGKQIVKDNQSVLDRQFETIMEVARPKVNFECKNV